MSQSVSGRELIIFRHAKSAWDSDATNDFERPLNKRGKRDAPQMGQLMHDRGLFPDLVISSTAIRAESTILAAAEPLGLTIEDIRWDAAIYEASVSSLIELLQGISDEPRRVLLVGHNPGLESLALYLIGNNSDTTLDYGFLKTATLVRIAMPDHWIDIHQGSGKLLEVIRPKDLAEEGDASTAAD